jgi:hypothetical protein
MSYQQTFTCDVCSAVRGPENHWLLAREFNDGTVVYEAWRHDSAICGSRTHLCGDICAATHLTRFIAKQREGTI